MMKLRMTLAGGLLAWGVALNVTANPPVLRPAAPQAISPASPVSQIPPAPGQLQAAPTAGVQAQAIPLAIQAVQPETAEATSDGMGKSTVNFVIKGVGVGECEVRLYTGEGGQYSVKVAPGAGFPKTIPVAFSKPGVFSIKVYGLGCAGDFNSMYTVHAAPDFPCSKYPGFKKATLGNSMGCVPPQSAYPNPADFVCAPGTKFQSYGGWVFGCFPPGYLKSIADFAG